MKRGRPRIYDWNHWFSGGRFTLRRGVDYLCSSLSMAQQIRSEASERKLSITIDEINNGQGLAIVVHPEGIGARASQASAN